MKSYNQQRAQDLPIWELVLTGGLGCCSMDPMQSHWDFCSSQEFSLYLLQAGFSNITTNSSGLFFILFYLDFFFFGCGPFFQVFIELVTMRFCFMFCFLGPKAWGILAPQPGIKLTPPVLEGQVLTAGPPCKSLFYIIFGFQCLIKIQHTHSRMHVSTH